MYLIQVLSEVYFLTTTLCEQDLIKFAAMMEKNPSVEAFRVSRAGRLVRKGDLGCFEMRKWLSPGEPWPALHQPHQEAELAMA
jgi:hypothetical protein